MKKIRIYDTKFTFSDMLFLNILSKREIIKTHLIIKQYSSIISKASASRTIKKLTAMGIIEPISSSTNYRMIHRRKIKTSELGIVFLPILDYNLLNENIENIIK